MRRIVFVITEDWFFASHFLPMARAAVAAGHETYVICRVRDHAAAIEATGARVIPFSAERSRRDPFAILREVAAMSRLIGEIRPDLVHCVALKAILVGGFAARREGVRARVYALTGLGFLGARGGTRGALARNAVRLALKIALDGAGVRYLFENPDDAAALRIDPRKALIVGGAGVDPESFPSSPLPPLPPLKVAVVSRMIRSKGVDLAVAATRLARSRGVDVKLTLHGAPDADNPRAIDAATLEAWSREPGVHVAGPTRDVVSVWRAHHVCCLPSRGGEGLPRALLEGAASGRAVVTTDVPGCRHFARDGVDGFVVPPDDPLALADAFAALAADPDLLARMGASARERVLEGYTERHVALAVSGLWAEMLGEDAR